MEENSLKTLLPKTEQAHWKILTHMSNSLCSPENLHLNVCNGFLHKQHKSERTHTCLWWIEKQAMIHPYKWTLLSNKCEQASNNHRIWMNLKYIILSERSYTQSVWYHSYDMMKRQERKIVAMVNRWELAGDLWRAGYNYQRTPENLGGWYNVYILILVVAVYYIWVSLVPQWQRICQCRRCGLIPGLGKALGEGNGNPLQYSCLGSPLDRETWQAAVYGVAKESDTT